MKLIDLLVQELPKRGGWPDGVIKIHQDYDGETWAWLNHDGAELLFTLGQVATNARKFGEREKCENMVTHAQYESALAASQKSAWNGEGLPPVGCECECQFLDAWHVCTILFVGAEVIVGVIDDSERAFSVSHTKFRPLQSEAKRKREVAAQALCDSCGGSGKVDENLGFGIMWLDIYDAIASGKIPGVKLDD